ncbi:MAG: flagellar assembly peptidoglycan hydrolase FlgJ [Pseudolabrys sp.]
MDPFTLPAPGLKPADLINAKTAAASRLDTSSKAKAKETAENFEAVFLNSMFQQMFTEVGGDGPFGGKGTTGVWRSLLTDEYAKSFAKAGGIGIADQVYSALIAQQEIR